MTNFTYRQPNHLFPLRAITFSLVRLALLSCVIHAAANEQSIPLFNGSSLKNWHPVSMDDFVYRGRISVENKSMVLNSGQPGTGLRFTGKLPTTNYEISLEAMRIEGFDFFCGLTFPVGTNFCTLIAGGWDGDVLGLSNINQQSAADNETTRSVPFEQNRWYAFRLRVEEDHITLWLDERKVFQTNIRNKSITIRSSMQPLCPLGLCSWYTKAAFRNIRMTPLKLPEDQNHKSLPPE